MAYPKISFAPRTILLESYTKGFFKKKTVEETATYVDILIDGSSLLSRFDTPKLVTLACDQFTLAAHDDFFNLLMQTSKQPEALPSGRVPVYVCAYCGEDEVLGCRIEINDTTVRWHDFALDVPSSHYDDNGHKHGDEVNFDEEFIFDKDQYFDAVKTVSSFAIKSVA